MKTAQPFLELDKKRGTLRLTLGDSFGRLLTVLALLVGLLFLGKNLSSEQISSLVKAITATVKLMP
jgi:hypothetical protein